MTKQIRCKDETKDTFDQLKTEYFNNETHDEILTILITNYIDRQESGVIGQIEKLHEFRDLLNLLDDMQSDLEYVRLQAEKWDEYYRVELEEE